MLRLFTTSTCKQAYRILATTRIQPPIPIFNKHFPQYHYFSTEQQPISQSIPDQPSVETPETETTTTEEHFEKLPSNSFLILLALEELGHVSRHTLYKYLDEKYPGHFKSHQYIKTLIKGLIRKKQVIVNLMPDNPKEFGFQLSLIQKKRMKRLRESKKEE